MRNNFDVLLDSVEWVETAPNEADSELPFATHEGTLRIGDIVLRVFQLSNGLRVIEENDLARFFGCNSVDELREQLKEMQAR